MTTEMLQLAYLVMLFAATTPQGVSDQSHIIGIPLPSGSFTVGRISYDWVDQTRSETLSKVPDTRREIMVDIWYPARSGKPKTSLAPYFPYAAQIDKSPAADEAEHNNLGALWTTIASGYVHADVYENAPPADVEAHFPLIIFSHSFNGEPWAYTHEITDLVSHGYIVATIHHTYEVTVAAFPDGRIIPFSADNARGSEAPSLEEILKWAEPRVNVWAGDILFTLDQLTRLNAAPQHRDQKNQKDVPAPFAGQLDLDAVGVMGHSFGGLAAERACELDQRIKVCVNQDGGLNGPFTHFVRGHLPTQPFMVLNSAPRPAPSDEELKSLRMTREAFEKDEAEVQAGIEKDFQGCSGGAYHVTFEFPSFRHTSFTDLPLVRAAGNPNDTATALHSLQLAESYTLMFFDKFLKSAPAALLDHASAKGNEVEIKRYVRPQAAK
jgi:hypothetical protein